MAQTLDYLLKLTDSFSGPMKSAANEQRKLTNGGRDLDRNAGNVNKLGSAFTGLAAKIGAAFTAYKVLEAGFSGIKKSLSMASAAETTATAFKTMLGSGEAAGALIERIKKLGAETPFEFPELANAGRMLLAFGESAADIPDTLRRIGDVSSAVAAPIGDIAEIYGKARTAGTLFSEDINQLTGRGIPIIREFAKILGQPESAIKKLAEEGKITFPMLDQAFRNLTSEGGQFFGMMEEQAKTSAGLWSTLSDAVGALYLRFGEPLNDAIKPILSDAIGLAGKLEPTIAKLGVHMAEALSAARNFVAQSELGGGVVAELGQKLKESLSAAGDALMIPFRSLGAGLPALGAGLMAVMRPTGEWMLAKFDEVAFKFGRSVMQQLSEALKELPPWLVGDAPLKINAAANAAGKEGNRAAAKAEGIESNMPAALKEAGDAMAKSVTDMRGKFEKEMQRFVAGLSEAESEVTEVGWMPDVQGEGMRSNNDTSQAPGVKAALDALKENGKAKQEEAKVKKATTESAGTTPSAPRRPLERAMEPLSPDSRYDENGRRRSDGRRKIERRKVDGPRDYSLTPYSGSIAGPDGGMRGNLNRFYARQSGLGGAGAFTSRPNLPSPGLAKRDQDRRETAATASRSAGGGGGAHPLAAAIKDIQTKLNSLAVAT